MDAFAMLLDQYLMFKVYNLYTIDVIPGPDPESCY